MRVLLVEDNAAVLENMQRMLRAMPKTEVVQVARTETQANDWLASHPNDWDVALVDLFLAEGHGFNVLQHCRKRLPHQRAVVVTNYTQDQARHYAAKAGADAVFDKSCEMDALLAYLAGLNKAWR